MKETSSKVSSIGPSISRTPSVRWTTLVSVSSTAEMRSAETIARGIIIVMNVAIMTAMRICMRYAMNAVIEPTSIWPESMRGAATSSTITLETLRMNMMIGLMRIISRPMRRLRSVSWSLTTP